jgi:hypothetical protein
LFCIASRTFFLASSRFIFMRLAAMQQLEESFIASSMPLPSSRSSCLPFPAAMFGSAAGANHFFAPLSSAQLSSAQLNSAQSVRQSVCRR